jgi:hypothetical protein
MHAPSAGGFPADFVGSGALFGRLGALAAGHDCATSPAHPRHGPSFPSFSSHYAREVPAREIDECFEEALQAVR